MVTILSSKNILKFIIKVITKAKDLSFFLFYYFQSSQLSLSRTISMPKNSL